MRTYIVGSLKEALAAARELEEFLEYLRDEDPDVRLVAAAHIKQSKVVEDLIKLQEGY